VIAPALARGATVVCDRFSPSTIVYQGCARGLGVGLALDVCRAAEGGTTPEVVVVLDVSDDVASDRASPRPDRVERAGEAFHRVVRAGYRELAPRFGWLVVDGNGSVDDVAEAVWAAVAPHL
jgi:dTMP kinase